MIPEGEKLTPQVEVDQDSATRPAPQDHTLLLMRICLIFPSCIILFYSLGERVLRTWDESIYAEVAREMLVRHSWLNLYWNFQPWVDKPPLFMWLTALMYRIFGVSEISARMVGALCGVATIWLTFEMGRRLMDDWSGLVAASILMTNLYFVFISRFGSIDTPLTLSLTVVAYAYVRVREGEPRWWYLAGAFAGMAVMIKSAAGLLAPLSLFLALVLDHRLSDLRTREVRNSAFLACAIALPWHLIMLGTHGSAFLKEYVGVHVMGGIRGAAEHPGPAYFHLWAYWHNFLPFALAALVGLLLHFKGQKKFAIVVSCALVVTAIYSLVGTKLMAYSLPAYPFISLLAAAAIHRLRAVKYAFVICVIVLFPLYWFVQKQQDVLFDVTYKNVIGWAGSINSREDPLLQLLVQARTVDSESSPEPLIIDLDGYVVQKQQSVFYARRPIIQAYTSPPQNGVGQVLYENLIPLEQAVSDRTSAIILRGDVYQSLMLSGEYDLTPLAENGPLVLAKIHRR